MEVDSPPPTRPDIGGPMTASALQKDHIAKQ